MNVKKSFWCSYDVKSLFTSIPLEEAIMICADQLFDTNDTLSGGFDRPTFVNLMKVATSLVEFSFAGSMYQQIDGVAMGSPLGPTLANIFLGYYEKKIMEEANVPLFYCRYVDDTFAVFDCEADCDAFERKLNTLHDALTFTSEKECENRLPFLDVLVSKNDEIISTEVYRKPSFTGLSMKWDSFCPNSMKIKLIATLVHRAIKICSVNKIDNELATLQRLFVENGFPVGIVQSTIRRKLDRTKQAVDSDPEIRTVVMRLPYIGKPSVVYGKRIASTVSRCYRSVSVVPIFTTRKVPTRALKDALPTLASSNIIYLYECHCGSDYVGKTTQILGKRIGQHVPPIFRSKSGRKYKLPKTHSSAIGQHLIENAECAEKYHDGKFSILARGRNFYHLSVLEAIFIRLRKPVLCRQKKFVLALKLLIAL